MASRGCFVSPNRFQLTTGIPPVPDSHHSDDFCPRINLMNDTIVADTDADHSWGL